MILKMLFITTTQRRAWEEQFSLDLKSPILNVKMPNNTSWLNLQEIKNDFVDRKINQLILSFNNQIPWNEKFSTFIIDGSL